MAPGLTEDRLEWHKEEVTLVPYGGDQPGAEVPAGVRQAVELGR